MNPAEPPQQGDDGAAQRIIFAVTAALLVLAVTYRLGEAQAPAPLPAR